MNYKEISTKRPFYFGYLVQKNNSLKIGKHCLILKYFGMERDNFFLDFLLCWPEDNLSIFSTDRTLTLQSLSDEDRKQWLEVMEGKEPVSDFHFPPFS